MLELFLYTLILAGSETLAMTALALYNKSSKFYYLGISSILYGIIIPYMILTSLNFSGIGTVNLLWNIATTVSMIVIGYYVFNEHVNHLHFISLLLGLASISVLYMADETIVVK